MSEMLRGMITEAELEKLMNLKPSELNYLRNAKGLPYVKLSVRKRVYLEDDLMEWFRSHRSVADIQNKIEEVAVKPTDEHRNPQEAVGKRRKA